MKSKTQTLQAGLSHACLRPSSILVTFSGYLDGTLFLDANTTSNIQCYDSDHLINLLGKGPLLLLAKGFSLHFYYLFIFILLHMS